jgi:ABC-2 type transport system ATP-binding protein
MEEVAALCTRVGIMDRGKLEACDTLPRLLQQLRGLVRFRVSRVTPALREALKGLPDCRLVERDPRAAPRPAPAAGVTTAAGRAGVTTPARLAPAPERAAERDGQVLELECGDVKGTLLRLVGLLNEAQVELQHLETEEPNLERVFLHLTGRALRD